MLASTVCLQRNIESYIKYRNQRSWYSARSRIKNLDIVLFTEAE